MLELQIDFIYQEKLKGFKTRQVGPKDGKDYVGGNYATAINLDTTLPMVFSTIESLDMRYFIDAANIWGVDYSAALINPTLLEPQLVLL